MTIDRTSRDALVAAIDGYCHDELTAFEFDETIFDIRDRTADETVRRVVDILWNFYDDCQDHHAVLDRVGWNYIQRLRLLLSSDATLQSCARRVWSIAQLLAAITLAAFAWAAIRTGLGQHLLLVAIPCGAVSIALSAWRRRLYRKACDEDLTLSPFTSLGQILWVGHSVPGFRKDRYRTELATRRIRDCGSELVLYLQMYVPWLLYGPVPLCFQMFPMSISRRKVVVQFD